MEFTNDKCIFHRNYIDNDFAIALTRLTGYEEPNDSILSDKSLIRIETCDGIYMHIHRCLLTSLSQSIGQSLDNDNQLMTNEEIVISLPSIVTADSLMAIISYIYHGIVSVPLSRVEEFLIAAKLLDIKGLKDYEFVNHDESETKELNYTKITQKSVPPSIVSFIKNTIGESRTKRADEFNNYSLPSPSMVSMNQSDNKKVIFDYNALRLKRSQGRRPQVGSPLITEDFKTGDRYRCKVCQKGYLWKKSLVRHYKDFHPNDVQIVTQETQFQ